MRGGRECIDETSLKADLANEKGKERKERVQAVRGGVGWGGWLKPEGIWLESRNRGTLDLKVYLRPKKPLATNEDLKKRKEPRKEGKQDRA